MVNKYLPLISSLKYKYTFFFIYSPHFPSLPDQLLLCFPKKKKKKGTERNSGPTGISTTQGLKRYNDWAQTHITAG
jgi:hypothetical protein